MGIFSKDKKELKQEALDDSNTSGNYPFPFTKVGDIHSGADYHATCLGVDSYRVHVGPYAAVTAKYGGSTIQSPATTGTLMLSGMTAREYIVDANTILQVISGVSLPNIGLPRMSKEQKAKLAQLRTDLEVWKKHQKLLAFKRLPSHIRQEVVDECLVQQMVDDIKKIDISKFPDYIELNALKNLEESETQGHVMYGSGGGGITSINGFGYSVPSIEPYRWSHIIDMFSPEELMKAHAEASLEDEISS